MILSMARRLATSPAAAPPTPSATATNRGEANTNSSLLSRRPTSLSTVGSIVSAGTPDTLSELRRYVMSMLTFSRLTPP